MRHLPFVVCLLLLVSVETFLVGCSRDPNIRKQKYLESGNRYFAKAEYSAAAIQFGNAIQVDPRYAAAHYQLARSYLRLQNWAKAYSELNRSLELDPENVSARLDLANLLIVGHDFDQAAEHVKLLAARQPGSSQVHIAIGRLHAAQEDFPVAIQELQKAIELDPGQADPYLELASLQLKTNQPDAAESSLEKAVALNPQLVNGRMALGNFYQSRRRFREAEEQFRSAIHADPRNPDPRISLAGLYIAQNKKAEAEKFLEDCKGDFPNNSAGYRMLGDFYFATGDLDKAIDEYAVLNQAHPKDWLVKKNYVQLLILKNRWEEAHQLNDVILKATPHDVEALIQRGQIQIEEGRPSAAVQTLQAALSGDRENGLAYYQLGVAFDRLADPIQAESAWQNAIRYRPDLMEAQHALALAALHKGDLGELEQASNRMIELQSTSAEGYALRSISYMRNGRWSQATVDVLKAIDLAPQDPIGYVEMGNLRLAQKKYREAERGYQQALDRAPGSAEALAGLINTYVAENQIAHALFAARAQITKVPDSSAFYDLLGTTLFDHERNQQDLEDAKASLEKAVQLDEHNTDAALKLSHAQAAGGHIDDAIHTCQRSLRNNPGDAAFYVLIGQLYDSRRDWEKAKDAYEKALQINPQDSLASNNLAYAMLQTGGDPDVAISLAQTARRGLPDSPEVADTLGWVFYLKGAYDSAIDQFQDALKLEEKRKSPENPTVHFHLGLAYQRIGRVDLARQHLQRVLTLDPNYSDADDVRKSLQRLPG